MNVKVVFRIVSVYTYLEMVQVSGVIWNLQNGFSQQQQQKKNLIPSFEC